MDPPPSRTGSLAGTPLDIAPTTEGAERAKELGASRYFSKPRDLAGFGAIATLILSHMGD
jgi:hypothetical protein